MDPADRISELVEPVLDAMGYNLVRVKLGRDRAATLQIMAEPRAERAMTVEDCADISRAVSALLDVEDPIAGAYHLEVSSPGLDRPLVRLDDYARFAGHEARIETHAPIDGRRRFKGRLLGVAEGQVRIALPEGEVALPYQAIGAAKLVLTEELITAAKRASERNRER